MSLETRIPSYMQFNFTLDEARQRWSIMEIEMSHHCVISFNVKLN